MCDALPHSWGTKNGLIKSDSSSVGGVPRWSLALSRPLSQRLLRTQRGTQDGGGSTQQQHTPNTALRLDRGFRRAVRSLIGMPRCGDRGIPGARVDPSGLDGAAVHSPGDPCDALRASPACEPGAKAKLGGVAFDRPPAPTLGPLLPSPVASHRGDLFPSGALAAAAQEGGTVRPIAVQRPLHAAADGASEGVECHSAMEESRSPPLDNTQRAGHPPKRRR